MDRIEQVDKHIQRKVERDIIKNRGLVRSRRREFSNPRVRRKLQYETMLKKRRSVVSEHKKGGNKTYKGQEQGITSGLVRGIKM